MLPCWFRFDNRCTAEPRHPGMRCAIVTNGYTLRVRLSGPRRHSSSARDYGIALLTRRDLRAVHQSARRFAFGTGEGTPSAARADGIARQRSAIRAPHDHACGSPMIAGSTMISVTSGDPLGMARLGGAAVPENARGSVHGGAPVSGSLAFAIYAWRVRIVKKDLSADPPSWPMIFAGVCLDPVEALDCRGGCSSFKVQRVCD